LPHPLATVLAPMSLNEHRDALRDAQARVAQLKVSL
jgi:hypothetical protein